MNRKIIFLMLIFVANIERVSADWPYFVHCPYLKSVVEPAGSSLKKQGFIYYSSRENEPYPAKKFVGADINSTYTFSCYYEVNDGTRITAKFALSKCSASHGFNSSGKCNNSDPEQCMVVCAY